MKKLFYYLRTAVLMFALAVFATGCGKDDEEKDEKETNPIAGKSFVWTDDEDCHLISKFEYCEYYVEVFKFNTNGTVDWYSTYWIGDEWKLDTDSDETYTYKVNGNLVYMTLTINDEGEVYTKEFTFKITELDGNIMLVEDGDEIWNEIKGDTQTNIGKLMNKHKDHPHEVR